MAVILNSTQNVHVEILLKQNSSFSDQDAYGAVSLWFNNHFQLLEGANVRENIYTTFSESSLSENISSISIFCSNVDTPNGSYPQVHYYVYRFNSCTPEIDEGDDEQRISTQWLLPTQEFHGLWESLIYDTGIKEELLSYVSTALQFSERSVDSNIISWNRIVLLHGPPGTGKTSLCKALAQKVCIRFSKKFAYGCLIEVNTHSLFSKWFSESGKLVSKTFRSILSILEDRRSLVIVLLDEVETLARSRVCALNGTEPSDAIRAVNALLTHLDMIKREPNVLILTTSNISEAIDVALIDRADIKKFIGLPCTDAVYQIYYSCIKELQKCGIIAVEEIYELKQISSEDLALPTEIISRSAKLKSIAEKSVGFSGRTLRKMPFIACSLYSKASTTLDAFLDCLATAVDKHWEDVKYLKAHT